MPRSWYSIQMKDESKDSAEISIYDAIGATWDGEGVTAKAFIAELSKVQAKNITLYINSPGGSLFDGVAIYNALASHGAEITAKIMGVAASAASLIAMAAHKIVMPANSFMMVHNASSWAFGTAAEMREWADTLDKIDQSMHATYARRSGKPMAEIKELLSKDTWLTAEEAVSLGLADEVQETMPVTAKFDLASLPESVRAAFNGGKTPEPKTPEASVTLPLAERVKAAADKVGLSEFSAHFALTIGDESKLQATLDAAREIKALCALAQKPEAAATYIKGGKAISEVRTELVDAMAAASESKPIDTAVSAGQTMNRDRTATFSTNDIWAARRKKST